MTPYRYAAFAAALLASAPAPVLAQIGSRATPVKPGEPCPAGMTEVRPHLCQAPELAAPSIVDYRPRSTLVVPAHPVPRPKFPAIECAHREEMDSARLAIHV